MLPGPGLVATTLITDGNLLWNSLLVTLITTFEGFLLAAVGGIGLAILFNQSRLVEYSFYPYAVILQVTPIVAIAPLLLIYLPQPLAVLVCAWIVAFFPVLANTTLGLSSVEPGEQRRRRPWTRVRAVRDRRRRRGLIGRDDTACDSGCFRRDIRAVLCRRRARSGRAARASAGFPGTNSSSMNCDAESVRVADMAQLDAD